MPALPAPLTADPSRALLVASRVGRVALTAARAVTASLSGGEGGGLHEDHELDAS